MSIDKDDKPPRWPLEPASPAAARTPKDAASPGKPPVEPGRGSASRGAGRVTHDERGNAVWDWLKETGRFCLESTSALLKRLEVPNLEVEGDKDEELRLESDRDAGGGYNPYGGGYDPHSRKSPVPRGKPPLKRK